jgi:hypothetical protein
MANAAFGALEEMRRVARSGGRVVISSNGPLAMRRLLDLHYQAALDAGYTPTEPRGSWFHLDHLEQVRDVFPRVERDVVESALEFSEPNPRCASTPQIVSTSSRMYRRMAATVRDCSSPDTQDGGGSAWNSSTIPLMCSPIWTWVSRIPTVPSGST